MAGPWEEYAAQDGPWNEYRAAAPKRPADTSRARGAVLGLLKPIDNAAEALQGGVNALFGTNFQSATRAASENQAARQANTRKGMQVVGNIAGTLPTLALPGGVVAQGAAGGALLSDARDLGGVLMDAGMGAVAGKVGEKIVGGVQRAIAPRLSQGVQTLTQEGVRMTPGQAGRASGTRAGEILGAAEDKLMSLPFVGDVIETGRKRAGEDFNRALLSRPLKAIGQTFPKGAPVGHDGIKAVGDVLSEGYNRTLRNLSGAADSAFGNAINGIVKKANLPQAQKDQLAEIVDREVRQILSGKFTGAQVGKVRDRLDKIAAQLGRNADNPYARDVGEAVGQVRDAVLAMVRRQNPEAAARLKALDRGWAELVRIERAAVNTSDGVITPQGYQQAVRGADRSVRRRAVSRGQALGQDFARTASQALPSRVPNSGTFDRMAANSLYTVAGAALAPAAAGAQLVTRAATRQAGPQAQRAAQALTPLRRAGATVGPALLLRPDE